MTLQQLKDEARKEFDEKFNAEYNFDVQGDWWDCINGKELADFIDSLIDKSYEEGRVECGEEYMRGFCAGERSEQQTKYRIVDRLCDYFGIDAGTKWSDKAVDLLIKTHEDGVEKAKKEALEEAAKIAESHGKQINADDYYRGYSDARKYIAKEIRNLKS